MPCWSGRGGRLSNLGYVLAHATLAGAVGRPTTLQMPLAPRVPLEVVLAGVDTDVFMAMFRQPMLVRARVFGPLGQEPCLQQA